MDDIVIYATSLEEHERKYNLLIERLCKANLKNYNLINVNS